MKLDFDRPIKLDDGYGVHNYYPVIWETPEESDAILPQLIRTHEVPNRRESSTGTLKGERIRYMNFSLWWNLEGTWYARPVQ